MGRAPRGPSCAQHNTVPQLPSVLVHSCSSEQRFISLQCPSQLWEGEAPCWTVINVVPFYCTDYCDLRCSATVDQPEITC